MADESDTGQGNLTAIASENFHSLNPKLCGNEQVFSYHAAAFDSSANGLFVLVRSGCINVAVSNLDSSNYASFTFGRIGYLKNTETKNGNFNAIV